jgi:unsaturated rhamnogalacturonyl hydrolase
VTDLDAVVATTERYPYRVWGFGESIAMHGLLEAGSARAARLVGDWAHAARPLAEDPLAHVAPGVPLLALHERARDARVLDRARELATTLAGTARGRHGARLHRPDLADWRHEVWVDCMHLDGPFLVRLARLDGAAHRLDLGMELLLGHARVLQDERTGLFWHGFDDAAGRANGVFWGRGQGWALLGLVDTLAALPAGHHAAAEARQRLTALAEGLRRCEAAPGRWHTVVDRSDTYLEASVGAFVALGIGDAVRHGQLGEPWRPLARRALRATLDALDASGALTGVSDATSVGFDAEHYGRRPLGVFPWGQGPALLALLRQRESP